MRDDLMSSVTTVSNGLVAEESARGKRRVETKNRVKTRQRKQGIDSKELTLVGNPSGLRTHVLMEGIVDWSEE